MSKPKKEYLSKIQQDQEHIGARLKAIRIANGIELKDIAFRNKAMCIERGLFIDGGQPITAHYLVQYCHEIGALLGPYNKLPEESQSVSKNEDVKNVCIHLPLSLLIDYHDGSKICPKCDEIVWQKGEWIELD